MLLDSHFQPSVSGRPKLLLTQRFDGTFAWPALISGSASNQFYYCDATGTDSGGHNTTTARIALNSPAGVGYRQENLIYKPDNGIGPTDVIAANSSDVDAVFTKSLAANDTPGGRGNKLVLTQLKRTPAKWTSNNNSTSTPQCWPLTMYRYSVNVNSGGVYTYPLPPLCYKFRMRLPANMASVLAGNPGAQAWAENWAIKGGDNNNNTQHRLAFKTIIDAGETGIRFELRFDLFNKNVDGTALPATQPTKLWDIKSAEGAAIPGDIYDIYIYFDQRPSISDLSGLAQIMVVNLSKNAITMAGSITGVPTIGYDRIPGGRIFWDGCYTFGFPDGETIITEYSDHEIWSSPPVLII